MSQLTLKDKERLRQPENVSYCLFVFINKFAQSLTDPETVKECKKIALEHYKK